MQVVIPSPLYSYTGGRARVEAEGASLAEILDDLERRYPGLRFRIVDEQGAIRPHIRFFLNRELTNRLDRPVSAGDELTIVAALSGG